MQQKNIWDWLTMTSKEQGLWWAWNLEWRALFESTKKYNKNRFRPFYDGPEQMSIFTVWNKLHRNWELFFVFYEKNYLKVAVIDQNWVVPGSSFNVQDYNIGTEVRVPYKKIFNFLKKWAIIYTSCKFYNCLKLNIF